MCFFCCNANLLYDHSVYTTWSNSFWKEGVGYVELFKQMTLIIPSDTTLLNPPIWYLWIEVKMFFLMPIITFLWNKNGPKIVIPILMLCAIFMFFEAVCLYFIGFMVRWLYEEKKIWIEKISVISLGAMMFVSFALLDISNITSLEASLFYINLLQSIGAAFIVLFFYMMGRDFYLNKKAITIVSFIGNISYEVYLFHFLFLLIYKSLNLTTVSYLLLSFCSTIATGIVVHYILGKMIICFSKNRQC